MISIIVPIHNQISMNKIFLKYIERYTDVPYELIVVDNNSSDGSADFFEKNGAKVIRNKKNMCYACSMNLGVQYAKYDIVVFANNDVIVSPNWASRLIDVMEKYDFDVVSPVGIEVLGKDLKRKWKRVRLLFGLGILPFVKSFQIIGSFKLMYGNWENFLKKYDKLKIKPGISGNFVLIKKEKFKEIGGFDPEIPASDWDIFVKFSKANAEGKNFITPQLVYNVYVHHFIRLTQKLPHKFDCTHSFKPLEEKWTAEEIQKYGYEPQEKVWVEY